MKFLLLPLALAFACSGFAAENFLKDLPPERFAAAGLNKLTSEELAVLEQIIRARSDGAAQTAASAAQLPPAKAKAPGWLQALVTLQETAEKPEAAEAIQTRLEGDYDGWTGKTVFKLENGQIWQQASGGERIDNARHAPAVKIYPGMMGAYWLEVEGVRERVKVRPVKLK